MTIPYLILGGLGVWLILAKLFGLIAAPWAVILIPLVGAAMPLAALALMALGRAVTDALERDQ